MKIIFCGNVVPEEYDTKLKYLSPAGNRFQINFCRELQKQGNDVTILSYIGFLIEDTNIKFSETKGFFDNNIYYIDKRMGTRGSIQEYTRKLRETLEAADLVISYNAIYAWILLPQLAKRYHTKSMLILADYTESKSYENWKKKLYASCQLFCIRGYDYVIGLSENTKHLLKSRQKFFCMEGGISDALYQKFASLQDTLEQVTFMYSGLLEPVTGIDMLLEAFHEIENDNVVLLISGKGSMDTLVEAYAKKDARIVNLGYMEYEDYIQRLGLADVLVNPRNMNLDENQNNFPSKIMEYLAAGKTIVSTPFVGYQRFKQVVSFCNSNINDMRECLITAIEESRENREEKYCKNREFARSFLWNNQIKKIIENVEKL